jgi:hypothetical protein
MAGFVAVHSWLIFPIWTRLGRGIPFAAIGGLALAAAFDRVTQLRGRQSMWDGARFGALMFATLVPETVFSNALRLAGVPANDWPGFAASLFLAAASGAAAGWLYARDRSVVLPFAGATLGLTIAMAGPIPVVNGPRAAWLFAGFLPICVGAGISVAIARAALTSER